MLKEYNNLKKVLICGDSFGVTDPDYPGLHFSEKILNSTPPKFELQNLSHGGDSNALIVLQLLQGLQFNPDFVILTFTSSHRYELDKDIKVQYPKEVSFDALREFRHSRYTTSCSEWENKAISDLIDRWKVTIASDDFEIIKNYFLIHYCFQLLEKENIPFCYSIGGMANHTAALDKNFVKNYINDYSTQQLKVNLWNHVCKNTRPYFHVDNDDIQTAFTNECLYHLKNANII